MVHFLITASRHRLNIIPKHRKIKIHSAESGFNKKRFLREGLFIIGFSMACLVLFYLSGCRNPKGEDGVSTLSISIHSDIKNTGHEYKACVGGLTKWSSSDVSVNPETQHIPFRKTNLTCTMPEPMISNYLLMVQIITLLPTRLKSMKAKPDRIPVKALMVKTEPTF